MICIVSLIKRIVTPLEFILPLKSLTAQRADGVFNRKPFSFHYCHTLQKHNLPSFENFKMFKFACSIYKILHGLAPPPLGEYIKLKSTDSGRTVTRASTRGDCVILHRCTTFCQSVLSAKGSEIRNNIPVAIRGRPTYPTFKTHLKRWLRTHQIYDH